MNNFSLPPNLTIEMNGEVLSDQRMHRIVELTLRQRVCVPAQIEVVFLDTGPDGNTFLQESLGAPLSLSLTDGNRQFFSGIISAVEYCAKPSHGSLWRIRAYDRLDLLRKSQHIRSHVTVTLSDIASFCTAGKGFNLSGCDSSVRWPWIIQYQETDLDFLTECASRIGLSFFFHDDTLDFFSSAGLANDPVRLKLGDTLLDAEFEVNTTSFINQIKTDGWDVATIDVHGAMSTTGGFDQAGTLSAAALAYNQPCEFIIPGKILPTQVLAEAATRASMDRNSHRMHSCKGTAEGDFRLHPGVRISIEGEMHGFNADYVLGEVKHTFDSHKGFVSCVATDFPAPHFTPYRPIATVGVVSSVEDPQSMGRVKASLPAYNNVETDWLSCLFPAAGADKGIVAMPDVSDRVLVLFIQNDPSSGVVIGSFYGTGKQPEEWGVHSGEIKKYSFLTRGGQKIVLDDTRNEIVLSTRHGNFLKLSPQKVTVHAEGQLEIDAAGHGITIRGNTIDFQQT
ncbi:MAG: hypothetical protein JW795_18170 [Chitinivibrionales bacterium]|nr:hypothetical protein [Chitinivibrionales bacterium]